MADTPETAARPRPTRNSAHDEVVAQISARRGSPYETVFDTCQQMGDPSTAGRRQSVSG
jgi:hypothetical protein